LALCLRDCLTGHKSGKITVSKETALSQMNKETGLSQIMPPGA
jgi:hypothetical protein